MGGVAVDGGTETMLLDNTGDLSIDGVLSAGDSSPDGNAYHTFGIGDADESGINGTDDVYVSGDLEIDGTFFGTIEATTVVDIWVNESGDTMTGNLTMADSNIFDANTIQANIIEDSEDSNLVVNDDLQVSGELDVDGTGDSTIAGRLVMAGNMSMADNNIQDANIVQANTLLDIEDNNLVISDNLDITGVLSAGDSTPDGNAYHTFGTGDADESGINGSDDVYVSGDLEIDGTFYGSLSADVVEDVWVNESGDTMTGDLNMGSNSILDVAGIQANTIEDNDDGTLTINDDLALTSGDQINFVSETGDKIYWSANTYGTGIETNTLTSWSANQFRWRTGGTAVGGGTEILLLDNTGDLSTDGVISAGDSTPDGNAYHTFGTGDADEASVSDADDVYVSGDLEIDGNFYGQIGASSVEDIWVNETGDIMTGSLNITYTSDPGLKVGDGTTGYIAVGGSSIYDAAGDLTLDSDSGEVYVADELGIGTNAPVRQLDVRGDGYFGRDSAQTLLRVYRAGDWTTSGTNIGIAFGGRGDGTHDSASDYRAGVFSEYNGDMYLSAQTATGILTNPKLYSKLFIEGSNGFIGIGDTTPDAKLDILHNGSGASFRVDDDSETDTTPFIIEADGDVGIGEDVPTGKLEVEGNTVIDTQTGTYGFYVTRLGGTSNQYNKMYVNDAWAYFIHEQDEDSGTRGGFIFNMDDDGTQDPHFYIQTKSGSTVLDVNKSGSLLADGVLSVGDSSPDGNSYHTFGTGDADEAGISGAEDVYISGDLEIDGTLYATVSADNVEDIWVNESGDTMTGALTIAVSANPGLTVNNGGTGYITLGGSSIYDAAGDLTLDSDSGEVYIPDELGIGTASPSAALDVELVGSGKALELVGENLDVDLHLGHDGSSYGFYWRYKGTDSGNNNDLELWANNQGGADVQVYNVHQDGNMGIIQNVGVGDTDPDAKLDVLNTGSGTSFRVDDSADGDTTPFIINASGAVGIGTATPSYKLDVNGNARFTGDAILQGNDAALTITDGGSNTHVIDNCDTNELCIESQTYVNIDANKNGDREVEIKEDKINLLDNAESYGYHYIRGVLSAGDLTPDGNAYHTFGTGDADEAAITDSEDVYISADLEIDGTFYGTIDPGSINDIWVNESGDTMSGDLNMNDNDIQNAQSLSFNNEEPYGWSSPGSSTGQIAYDLSGGLWFHPGGSAWGSYTSGTWYRIMDTGNTRWGDHISIDTGGDSTPITIDVDDDWVNESGDSMSGDLNMSDNNIYDANTIQANILEDGEDGVLTINDDLTVSGGDISITSASSNAFEMSGSGEVDIHYTSTAGGGTWQVGTGWAGANYGADSFFWYKAAERMNLDDDGDLRITGDATVVGGNLYIGDDAEWRDNGVNIIYTPDSLDVDGYSYFDGFRLDSTANINNRNLDNIGRLDMADNGIGEGLQWADGAIDYRIAVASESKTESYDTLWIDNNAGAGRLRIDGFANGVIINDAHFYVSTGDAYIQGGSVFIGDDTELRDNGANLIYTPDSLDVDGYSYFDGFRLDSTANINNRNLDNIGKLDMNDVGINEGLQWTDGAVDYRIAVADESKGEINYETLWIDNFAGTGRLRIDGFTNGVYINDADLTIGGGDIATNVIPRITPIYLRGTGLNNNANKILEIGSSTQYNTGGRGLRLTVIRKSDHVILSDSNYDTYGSAAASNNLATALNAMTNAQIGVLTSYDAWEASVTANLDTAFQRKGLYKAAVSPNSGSRRPYAAIFEGASSSEYSDKAVECLLDDTVNQPYCEIRGWLIDGSFTATGTTKNTLTNTQGTSAGVVVNEAGAVGLGTISPSGGAGDLTVMGDNVYFGTSIPYITGSGAYIDWNADHATVSGMRFYNNGASLYGYIYGTSSYFGLLNNAGNWGIRIPSGTQNVQVLEDLYVGYNSGSDNDYVYFDQSNEYLAYDDPSATDIGGTGTGRFELSDDLEVEGNVRPSGALADNYHLIGVTTLFGNAGQRAFRTTSTSFQQFSEVYGPFSYSIPTCPSGTTVQYKLYVEYVDSMTTSGSSTLRIDFSSGTDRDFTLSRTWGASPYFRNYLSSFFTESNTNHATLQIRLNSPTPPSAYIELRLAQLWTYCT